jgi:hypothetical protein
VASLGGGRAGGEWLQRLRESVHPWNAVPLGLIAVTLTAGGFWLGNAVSGDASATPATRTIRLAGRVITVNGVQYVSTPARIVKVKGKDVRLAAQTLPLAGHTTLLPGSTVRVATTVNDTVVRTDTVQVTVTAPASTVTGPTTTVSEVVTVPVISTVTVTLP